MSLQGQLEAGKTYELEITSTGGHYAGALTKAVGDVITLTNVTAASSPNAPAGSFDFDIDGVRYLAGPAWAAPQGSPSYEPAVAGVLHPDDHGGTGTWSIGWFERNAGTIEQFSFNAGSDGNHGVYYVTLTEVAAAGATGDPFVTPMLQ